MRWAMPLLRLCLLVVLCSALGGCRKDTQGSRPKVRMPQLLVEAELGVEASMGAVAADGWLAVGTRGGGVLLVSADRKQRRWVLPGAEESGVDGGVDGAGEGGDTRPRHDGPISALAFSRDGTRLLSAGGRSILWWQVRPSTKLLAQIRGPQAITAAVLDATDRFALLGTFQGHVLRWPLNTRPAQPLPRLSCGGMAVGGQLKHLPAERRCPSGTFVELPGGRGVCTYPATHLLRQGKRFALACRTGTVTLFELESGLPRYYLAGALTAMAFITPERMLFARRDGEARVYDFSRKKLLGVLPPRVRGYRGRARQGRCTAAGREGQAGVVLAERPAPRSRENRRTTGLDRRESVSTDALDQRSGKGGAT